MLRKNNKGFTLIEVIVVIGILAAMTAFIVPSFITTMQQARIEKDETKFTSMCTAFKSACSEPEVQKETEKVGEGGTIQIVYYIDGDGKIDFSNGEMVGTTTIPMQNSSLWLCSYQTIGLNYSTESQEFSNEYLVFTLTPKTQKSTAQCTYEVTDVRP